MTLKELNIGESAVIETVGGQGALRQHFLDMGLIPGEKVTLVKFAPMGDPMELQIHGYALTLRLDDAARINVSPAKTVRVVPAARPEQKVVEHPGLGEGGRYHTKKGENPLPDGTTLTFALAGNQNCGKTTLFNQLTGSNQHVGNFPGVTVDRKSGAIKGHPETEVTDLPGIYSMSPYSSEEIVTRQFLINEKPTGIINIVDATNIERNLYLTMQLMELDTPMVLALNMMDEVRGNGGTIRINKMEAMLGIPVVPISAAKNEGVDELVDHAIHVAKYQERPGRLDFCGEDDHGGAVHRCIHGIIHLIEDHAKTAGIPVRFAATKLVEGDHRIEEALQLDQNEKEMIEHIILQMEQERGLDRAAAIADMRFHFIHQLVAQTVVKPHQSKEQLRSNRIDRILTGKYTAIPAFVGIMALVFYLTFGVIGSGLQDLLAAGIDRLTTLTDNALTAWEVNPAVHSLVIDGIFTGVGSVLSFLPIIVVLFFFLSPAGRYRLHGPCGVRHGQTAPPHRSFGPQHRAHAHRLWLYGARRHGQPHPPLGAGPQNDHSAHAVHELLGKAAHLQPVCGGIFPASGRVGHGGIVFPWHPRGRRNGHSPQGNGLQGRGRALCDGAAQLSPAGPEKRGPAALGKGPGFPRAGVYGHLYSHHRHLVPAEL